MSLVLEAEAAEREWVKSNQLTLRANLIGVATADAAHVYATQTPEARLAGKVFMETARRLLVGPAEEKGPVGQ